MNAGTPILTFPRRGGRDLFRGFLDREFHVHQRSVLLGAVGVRVLVREELASTGINTRAASPVYTGERRKTVRQGLRILARIIARAHVGRDAERDSAAAPGPPL